MAKFTLNIVDEYPYTVYGLNTTTVDYRLCWNVNKSMTLALKKADSIGVYAKENGTTMHNYFTCTDEHFMQTYHLVENKRGNSIYLPEVKEADYLFIVNDDGVDCDNDIIKKLKAIRSVLMVFPINLDKLKHKQNLLLLE